MDIMKSKLDSASYRQIMGCFTTGVAVATVRDADLGAVGLTINSLTSVSLDPPLLLFCIEKSAFLHKIFRRTDVFAINILAAGQENISRHFASWHHNPKPKNMWDKAQHDCPILRGTLGWILCRTQALHAGGDHTIIVGEAIAIHKRAGGKEPLAYFHGRYRDLAAPKLTSGARK
jgi:flavin reductase (DIM6/NTAB) family NADH-FMN oxidoreductase RutF